MVILSRQTRCDRESWLCPKKSRLFFAFAVRTHFFRIIIIRHYYMIEMVKRFMMGVETMLRPMDLRA